MKRLLLVGAVLLALVPAAQAKKLKLSVHIVGSQTTSGTGTYTVPGYASANCNLYDYGTSAYANCFGASTPARTFTYTIQGATLSLLLPDERIVVVTCEKKTNWTEWSMRWYRDCRIPAVSELTAEFEGDKAKLEWSVSLDGSKKKSETYKIVAILSKIPAKPD